MAKKKTREEFIADACKLNGKRYDYSEVVYVNSTTHVTIRCREHGEFQQSPAVHLSGRQCSICGRKTASRKKKLTHEEFFTRMEEVHGGRYTYPERVYRGLSNQILVHCPIHGEFRQKANNHSSGKGCWKCASAKSSKDRARFTTRGFIEYCKVIHNNYYDYSKTVYKSAIKKLTITCPIHGDFEQSGQAHYEGCGCPECGIVKRWYVGGFGDKVEHYKKENLSDEPCYLYLYKIFPQNEEVLKVGITTNEDVLQRGRSIKTQTKSPTVELVHAQLLTLETAYKLEQKVKEEFYEYRHKPVKRFYGWTECFSGIDEETIVYYIQQSLLK